MQKLGYNIHTWNDSARRMVYETRPPVVLVLAANVGGNLHIIDGVKAVSPETQIIYRPLPIVTGKHRYRLDHQ